MENKIKISESQMQEIFFDFCLLIAVLTITIFIFSF